MLVFYFFLNISDVILKNDKFVFGSELSRSSSSSLESKFTPVLNYLDSHLSSAGNWFILLFGLLFLHYFGEIFSQTTLDRSSGAIG